MTAPHPVAAMSATPGNTRQDDRPPIEMEPAQFPGVAAPMRRTARKRRIVTPHPWPGTTGSTSMLDEHARRRWCAVIGPGAVADLLRLATAAARGRSLPRPINLDTLARYGLVTSDGQRLLVQMSFPAMSVPLLRRLHPSLRGAEGGPASSGAAIA